MLESQSKSENQELKLPNFLDDDSEALDNKTLVSSQRSRKRRRNWFIGISIFLLIIIIAGIVLGPRVLSKLQPPHFTYQYKQVTQGDLSVTASATGQVQSNISNAEFLAAGKVSEIDVKAGQKVKAGQILAKLDATALSDALKQAKDALTQAKNSGNQDAITIAQDQVNAAQHNLNNTTLYAPYAGTVVTVNGSVGGSSTAGSNGFIQIVDTSSLQIQANVSESDITGVGLGETVQFTVSAYNNRVFSGTVSAISPLGQSVANVVTYPVIATVDMKGLQGASLLPGMTANVTIIEATRSQVLLVPVDTVNFAQSFSLITSSDHSTALTQAKAMLATLQANNTTLSKENPTVAYVLEKDKVRWTVKPVVLGLTDGTYYEVLAGLNLNDTLAVSMQNGSTTPSNKSPNNGGGGSGLGGGN